MRRRRAADTRGNSRTAIMPWKVLLTIVCYLWINFNKQVLATGAVQDPKDSQSVPSVNNNLLSFFKNAPMAIYASAVPHGAYSFQSTVFQVPANGATVYRTPVNSGSSYQIPVKSGPLYKAPVNSASLYQSFPNSASVFRAPTNNGPVHQAPTNSASVFRAPAYSAPVYQAPANIASNLVPVRNENIVYHKQSGYLTDSYGNKFLETPQSISYKTVFPQQFVPLQDLPAHLSQPFVAAPTGFHLKQALPQFSYGTPLRLPQALNTRGPAPLVYAQNTSPLPLQFQANFGNLPLQNFPFTASQQPSNQQAVFSNANSYKPFATSNSEPEKFQRLEKKPINVQESEDYEEQSPSTVRPSKASLTKLTEQFVVTTVKDGKKTVVSIPTKPSLPVLDPNLLEPLVFDNPVVPQVQHFLPKITYPILDMAPVVQAKHKHREFLTQNTKYYGGPIITLQKGLDKSEGSFSHSDDDVEHKHLPNDFQSESPEEKYNNAPNHANNDEQDPSYNINNDNEDDSNEDHNIEHHSKTEHEEKTSHQENRQKYYGQNDNHENLPYKENRSNQEKRQKYYTQNNNHKSHEGNEKRHDKQKHEKPHKQIHTEKPKPQVHHKTKYNNIPERAPKQVIRFTSDNPKKIFSQFKPIQGVRQPNPPIKGAFKIVMKHHAPLNPQYVDKTPKRIIIKEEVPVQHHSLREQMLGEVIKEEENNEEDFEKAYKNAAFGFPGYNQDLKIEKDIYNPDSYGAPKYHEAFDFENSPFEDFFHNGDEFPKSQRLTYKDVRNHNIDDYMKDFNAKYPKEMKEFLKSNKEYFKDYKSQPYYFSKIKNEKSGPDFILANKKKNDNGKYLSQYKAKPEKYEFDYSKIGNPRDNYAHATKPGSSYRHKLWSNTQFVEPQFQYGFEPIPKLLDSELAAMASNDSPESGPPGSRKKIYKENWYIHKTSTAGKS